MTPAPVGAHGTYDPDTGLLYGATVVGYVNVRCPVIRLDPSTSKVPEWARDEDPEPFVVLPENFEADE